MTWASNAFAGKPLVAKLLAAGFVALSLLAPAAAQSDRPVATQADQGSLASALKGVTTSVSFRPVMMPVTLVVDQQGNATYEVSGSISTPIGVFNLSASRPVVMGAAPKPDGPMLSLKPDPNFNERMRDDHFRRELGRRVMALEEENRLLRSRLKVYEPDADKVSTIFSKLPVPTAKSATVAPASDWSELLKKLDRDTSPPK